MGLVIRKVCSHCLGGAIHLHEEQWHASRGPRKQTDLCVYTLGETWNHCGEKNDVCKVHSQTHATFAERKGLEDAPTLDWGLPSIRLLLKVVQRVNLQTFQTWQPPPKFKQAYLILLLKPRNQVLCCYYGNGSPTPFLFFGEKQHQRCM